MGTAKWAPSISKLAVLEVCAEFFAASTQHTPESRKVSSNAGVPGQFAFLQYVWREAEGTTRPQLFARPRLHGVAYPSLRLGQENDRSIDTRNLAASAGKDEEDPPC